MRAAGDTGRRAARVSSAAAGTFSNSVVMARAELGQAGEAGAIEVGGGDVLFGDASGRAAPVGIEHRHGVAASLRGVREHPAELAAAHDAKRRARRDEGRRRSCRRAHFRSADIARAASVWRARNASSFERSDASAVASIATAKSAALTAPALPMAKVATGMPRGIWTME